MPKRTGSSISNGSKIEQIGCFGILAVVVAIAAVIVYAVVFA